MDSDHHYLLQSSMNPTSFFLTIIGPSIGIICPVVAFITAHNSELSPLKRNNNNFHGVHVDPFLISLHEHEDEYLPSDSSYSSSSSSSLFRVSSRKQFLSTTSILGAAILHASQPTPVSADEPSSHYQSSGISLGNGIVDPIKSQLNNDGSQFSFSDIAFPSTTTMTSPLSSSAPADPSSSSLQMGDLNKALQNKVGESQRKRTINPLTHG